MRLEEAQVIPAQSGLGHGWTTSAPRKYIEDDAHDNSHHAQYEQTTNYCALHLSCLQNGHGAPTAAARLMSDLRAAPGFTP